MKSLATLQNLVGELRIISSLAELEIQLTEICRMIGARYYALTQHVDPQERHATFFRLHNYPTRWVERFDAAKLSISDPVHRASHTALTGFRWSHVPRMIAMTPRDHQILYDAGEHGLGGGFTIPAHVPGEILGSCSFAAAQGDDLNEEVLPFAQIAGQFAFESARRLVQVRPSSGSPALTDRQLECVMWVARGKTDWEIAHILGVTPHTVGEHLRHARERCGAATRAMLPVRALYDGALSFTDLLGDRYPSNPV